MRVISGAASLRRIALVLAALFAFAGHDFLTRTHVHFPSRIAGLAANVGGQRLAKPDASGGFPAGCPICREYLHAGHYLPPAPLVIAAAIGGAVWLFVPLFVAWHGRSRSHAWRSRGPPTPLQP